MHHVADQGEYGVMATGKDRPPAEVVCGESRRIAVKVIDECGNELMAVREAA